uniref:SH3 domain-containing protein n=1 Tax=Sinocyclocheilus rhinocerous TaxID=307959 RepID=A0A673JL20_9TELE
MLKCAALQLYEDGQITLPDIPVDLCGFVCYGTHAALMEKLADFKVCADKDCSCEYFMLSMAKALEDYVASDCRYINLKRGQMIYVFSKLKPVEGAGVYGERYVDQVGVIGYFPSNHVNETMSFSEENG